MLGGIRHILSTHLPMARGLFAPFGTVTLSAFLVICAATLPAPRPDSRRSDPLPRPVLPGDPHVQLQENGQRLRIGSSHLGDEGRYQCVAFSPAGQQAKDFQLRIQGEPGPCPPLPGHWAASLGGHCAEKGQPGESPGLAKSGERRDRGNPNQLSQSPGPNPLRKVYS